MEDARKILGLKGETLGHRLGPKSRSEPRADCHGHKNTEIYGLMVMVFFWRMSVEELPTRTSSGPGSTSNFFVVSFHQASDADFNGRVTVCVSPGFTLTRWNPLSSCAG